MAGAKTRFQNTRTYSFKARIWKYKGKASWHFVTLPKALSKKIRLHHGESEQGWGRLSGTAQIQNTQWKTAIWFDSKANSYLLPVKAAVRKAEDLDKESLVLVHIVLDQEKRALGTLGW